MFYYQVLPASQKYSGREPLKYCCDKNLSVGQVVTIKFRKYSCGAIVSAKSGKPSFKTQPIAEVHDGLVLPKNSVALLSWMRQYYPGPIGQTTQLFLPSNLKPKAKNSNDSVRAGVNKKLPALTVEQKSVLKSMRSSKNRSFWLHGATGSGKTRVYIELAKRCINDGKSVIVLTPEISLTPQLAKAFGEVFADKVLITHSGLTATERSRVWQKCAGRNGPWVVLGPRSAIFSPLDQLGLIVIDEAHDDSYKQDSSPFYQTIRVAGYLSSLTGAQLVMGSATPPVSEYYFARNRKIPILEMSKLAVKTPSKIESRVIDMRDKSNMGRFGLISRPLETELAKALKQNVQAMVFINKRGDSKSIVCQNCGWQAKCKKCDLPLTYHGDESRFSCHTCGRHYAARTTCETCGSTDIIFKSPGTKAVAGYLAKLFPQAKIARFDTDNKKLERIDSRHAEVTAGDIDILVGTQILTKGHDLPNLGLAVMLLAESGLNFPDYTAEERTYQTIRQLSGRVGRGHRDGLVLIQSFTPDNSLLAQAIRGDYQKFYEEQIEERQTYGFPPFYHVMKVSSSRATSASSLKSAQKIHSQIADGHPDCIVLGPSPAFYFRRGGFCNWQIIVKSKTRRSLADIINKLPANHTANIDPVNLL